MEKIKVDGVMGGEVPTFVGSCLSIVGEENCVYVPYDDPRAAEYAKRHLEQVKEPIVNALKIIDLHHGDGLKATEELRQWLGGLGFLPF